MYLLSNKGVALVLLGVGLCLGLLRSSDALMCYHCTGTECDGNPPNEKDCTTESNGTSTTCVYSFGPEREVSPEGIPGKEISPEFVPQNRCGRESDVAENCDGMKKGKQRICVCDTDHCNIENLGKPGKEVGKEGNITGTGPAGSTEAPKSTASSPLPKMTTLAAVIVGGTVWAYQTVQGKQLMGF